MPILARRRPSGLGRLVSAVAVASLVGSACTSAPSASPTAAPTGSGATGSQAAAAAPTCGPIPPVAARPWWVDTTFYEVFVRSFADSNGDGTGDLDGLTSRLPYLQDLGVGALWLMPIAESGSYHGYDVIDYTKVEQDYGDAAAFKRLVAAAHAAGIRVILDFVINHTSSQNAWFKDALVGGSHHDWYLWSPTDPGWPSPVGGNPWHPSSAGFYYGVFSDEMPDLNLTNAAATGEIHRAADFWLTDMDVDGFRIDAAPYLVEDGKGQQVNTPETYAWLAAFRDGIHATKPDSMDVGEVWQARAISAKYVNQGSLDMAFDFGIGPAILNGVQGGDPTALLASQDEVANRYTAGPAGTFLSNHDQVRWLTGFKGGADAAKQAAALLLTGPGVPFLYYGEEIGLTGGKPDQDIRRPMPWTSSSPTFGFTSGTPWEAVGDGADTANVQSEATDPASLLAAYRTLVHLRGGHPALQHGGFTRVTTGSKGIAAGLRSSPEEQLLVVSNLTAEAAAGVTLDLASGGLCGAPKASVLYPASRASGTIASPTVDAGGGFAGYIPVPAIPPRTTVVISLTR